MLHIAFLTPEYPHAKVAAAAGIGTSVKNLAVALAGRGLRVSVIVHGQKSDEVLDDQGIQLHLIQARKFPLFTFYYYRKFIEKYVNDLIGQEQIDLIEAPDWCGITAFMRLNVPVVIRFHGSDAYFCRLENRKQKLKNFLFEKWAIQRAVAFIAPTNFAGKLSQEIFKIRDKEIKTIHYGLSLKQFHNPDPKQYERGLILYIGTIIRKKGVLELPHIYEKVLEQYPDAKLVIIGSDSYDLKTKSESTWLLLQNALNGSLYSKVKYLGKVPYEQVQEFIRKANVCVFPTFAETLGMVTIESMAMQKPVINSDMGWSRELMEDGKSGFLVDPKDHQRFADCIGQLISDEKLCEKMGVAARERVEQEFDIEQIAQQNIAFYQSVVTRLRKE